MRPREYSVTEYGGKHGGSKSVAYDTDSLVLNRDDLSYILHRMRVGNKEDKDFAKKMYATRRPHGHCDCCGKFAMLDRLQSYRDGKICLVCERIMRDVEYVLENEGLYGRSGIEWLKDLQKSRSNWMISKANYLVTADTYPKYLKLYKEFQKRHTPT